MSKAQKFYTILAVVFGLLCVIILSIEIFGFLNLSTMQSSFSETEYRLSKLTDQTAILTTISRDYQKALKYQEYIDIALPDQKEVSNLVSDLDSLSSSSGLKLTVVEYNNFGKAQGTTKDLSLLQTVRGKNSYELPLSIEVTGPYNSFVSFIQRLENYQRLVNISSVDIEKSQEKDAPPDKIDVKINLTAYLK
jgi:Tfp pilus assembly protein PilO